MAEWQGARYKRVKSKTLRDGNTGVVYNSSGVPIDYEPTNKHFSGDDRHSVSMTQRKKQFSRRYKKPVNRVKVR